jgi:hypothetical protein
LKTLGLSRHSIGGDCIDGNQLFGAYSRKVDQMIFACSGLSLFLFSIIFQDNPKEQALVQEIEKLGGQVTRNEHGKLVGVHLGDFGGGLRPLYTRSGNLPAELTDERLLKLDLRPFTHVSIVSRSISDRGLAHLEKIPNLESFRLMFSPKITDAGVAKFLKKHRSLSFLSLSFTSVTDDSLSSIAELADLEGLSLLGNNITDKGLKSLERLRNLSYLCLAGTKISDAGLRHLSGMKNLSGLDLVKTQVSDAGIVQLSAVKGLRTLSIASTKVTPQGEEALRNALPLLEILK